MVAGDIIERNERGEGEDGGERLPLGTWLNGGKSGRSFGKAFVGILLPRIKKESIVLYRVA